ncbi:S8 family peptidase [Terrimonas alba]|uniref:S8 family peptidase n=1 Tax=Terrimonas alba TaxID=3349636 RepID=UPI0035F3183B
MSMFSRISTIYEYDEAGVIVVRSSWKDIVEKIADRPEVLFIEQQRAPKEEVAVSNLDLSANKVNLVHSEFPFYNGQSLVVSVKENKPDTADIDFKGRYISTSSTSPTLSGHATIMATIIAGAGNTYYEGKGVATAAGISSTNFSNLLPEPGAYYQQYNITVQNHSYGTEIENYYGADAAAYDASVSVRAPLLHVFSAGNSGTLTSNTGKYAGIAGYANLTGSFKMAKNILTVGHIDSFGTVLPASSRGPAYDGRVKPELAAFALDGSSGATAIVSGVGLVLQDAYKQLKGTVPSSDLVKAILLNSADDVHTKGIDFVSGYGSVNAHKAMQELAGGTYFQNIITAGSTNEHDIFIPANTRSVKVTLVWNDPAAAANAPKALINDLDLELVQLSTNQVWQPWVLNHFPNKDSLSLLPVRKRDSLNNIEQVSIDNPGAGNYIIRIRGFNVLASQSYAVAFQFEKKDNFVWAWPSRLDNVISGTSNTLRWENSFENENGVLEYSINNSSTWEQVNSSVDLGTGYYKWQAPDTFATALLRMTIQGQQYISDTFTISNRINVSVGFNCPDSFLLYWNRPASVDSFQVYKLGDRYLESMLITRDTTLVLGKNLNTAMHYSVAPVVNGRAALKSFAINYHTQGVDCYVKSFLGSSSVNAVQLELQLGSIYQVQQITVEKFFQDNFQPTQIVTFINGTFYSFTDALPINGINIYRVKIELSGGRVVYSEPVNIYYLGKADFHVFPNPVERAEPVTILSNQSEEVRMQVYNTAGMKVHEEILFDLINTVSVEKLSRGLYFIRFVKKDNTATVIKLLVN